MGIIIDADAFLDHARADAYSVDQCVFAARLEYALKTEKPVDAIPVEWIKRQADDPYNAGAMSMAYTRLLQKWRAESDDDKH